MRRRRRTHIYHNWIGATGWAFLFAGPGLAWLYFNRRFFPNSATIYLHTSIGERWGGSSVRGWTQKSSATRSLMFQLVRSDSLVLLKIFSPRRHSTSTSPVINKATYSWSSPESEPEGAVVVSRRTNKKSVEEERLETGARRTLAINSIYSSGCPSSSLTFDLNGRLMDDSCMQTNRRCCTWLSVSPVGHQVTLRMPSCEWIYVHKDSNATFAKSWFTFFYLQFSCTLDLNNSWEDEEERS